MPTLQDYIDTGFSPEQIVRMYKNLTEIYDLISRLIMGDMESINEAVNDAVYWLDGYASYSKEGMH